MALMCLLLLVRGSMKSKKWQRGWRKPPVKVTEIPASSEFLTRMVSEKKIIHDISESLEDDGLLMTVWSRVNDQNKAHAIQVNVHNLSEVFAGKRITAYMDPQGQCPTGKTATWIGREIVHPKGNLCAHCTKLPPT